MNFTCWLWRILLGDVCPVSALNLQIQGTYNSIKLKTMRDKTATSVVLYHQQELPHPSSLPIQTRSSEDLIRQLANLPAQECLAPLQAELTSCKQLSQYPGGLQIPFRRHSLPIWTRMKSMDGVPTMKCLTLYAHTFQKYSFLHQKTRRDKGNIIRKGLSVKNKVPVNTVERG